MSTLASVFGYGLLSARAAASVAGRFYYATDTQLMYRDNGSTWDTLGLAGAGTGTVTTVKNEGSNLSTAVVSMDFVGPGVNATGTTAVTVTIPAPGAELDYVEFTGTVSPTATTEATANTVVTGSAVAYDGSTVVLIEFFAPDHRADNGGAGNYMNLWLYDGSSSIGQLGFTRTPASGNDEKPMYLARRLTPSAATHTYSLRASVNTGTGRVGVGAGGAGNYFPGYIRITRV